MMRTINNGAYVISDDHVVFRREEKPGNEVGDVIGYRQDGQFLDAVKVHWKSGDTTVEYLDAE